MLTGRLNADDAFNVSQIDDIFQIEHWGEDTQAVERQHRLQGELRAAEEFLKRLNANRIDVIDEPIPLN